MAGNSSNYGVLLERVRENPAIADEVSQEYSDALNEFVPTSGLHPVRYRSDHNVPAAISLASMGAVDLSPYSEHPDLTYLWTNVDQYPDEWVEQPMDFDVFGINIGDNVRNIWFAEGKSQRILRSGEPWSYKIGPANAVDLGDGMLAYAGGRRFFELIAAFSGLWELDDHKITALYVGRLLTRYNLRDPEYTSSAVEIIEKSLVRIRRGIKDIDDIEPADFGKITHDQIDRYLHLAN